MRIIEGPEVRRIEKEEKKQGVKEYTIRYFVQG
jgi:hypothetical protein